jgi:hypothetical protein
MIFLIFDAYDNQQALGPRTVAFSQFETDGIEHKL